MRDSACPLHLPRQWRLLRPAVTAAEAMLAEGHDGRTLIGCAFGSRAAGVWQPLAGSNGMPLCDPTPWVGDAVPFIVKSPSQFRTAGPHSLTSAAYAADLNEVKAIGALDSATRTAAQSHAAAFWQTNPAANYNAIARRFADQLSLDLSASARLFAMLDLSAADALITTWNSSTPQVAGSRASSGSSIASRT
jgi:hypothetical protein